MSDVPVLEPKLGDGPDHVAACHLPMAAGENLADFHPTIDAAERVLEDARGLLSESDAQVTEIIAAAVPDALPAQPGAQPEGSKQ